MTQTKWTPGPWTVEYKGGCTRLETSRGVTMCDENYYPWAPDNDADWHLIAAAPDLYDALKELSDLFDAIVSGEYVPDSFTTQPAHVALAKARGEVE